MRETDTYRKEEYTDEQERKEGHSSVTRLSAQIGAHLIPYMIIKN